MGVEDFEVLLRGFHRSTVARRRVQVLSGQGILRKGLCPDSLTSYKSKINPKSMKNWTQPECLTLEERLSYLTSVSQQQRQPVQMFAEN